MNPWAKDDDWFYESIKRYKTLLMFDFSTAVKQMQLADAETICMAFVEKSGHSEIVNMSIPKKLIVPRNQEGLTKDSDLKIKCGGFSDKPLAQSQVLHEKNILVTSEMDVLGVNVYKWQPNNTDMISKDKTVPCDLMSPRLSYNRCNLIAMMTTNKQNIHLLDTAQTFVIERTVKHQSEGGSEQTVQPTFVSPNLLGISNTGTGLTSLLDIRSNSASNFEPEKARAEVCVWTATSSFQNAFGSNDSNDESKVALLSSAGSVCIFDVRNLQAPFFCANIQKVSDTKKNVCSQEALAIRFCPLNSSLISVSGFNSEIFVFDISAQNLQEIFVHDGHGRDKDGSIVTDHIWYKQSIISACDDLSVHCWQGSSM